MLSLEKPITIDGVTVFRDHADPNQFWYLPGPVSLARRAPDDRAAFTFLKYKSAVTGAGVKGGGFLTVESTLRLPRATETRINSRLMSEPGVTPPIRLAAAPFEEGSVQCIALNVQGSGGTAAQPAPPGAFNAVERILGATTPSMDADNKAAFSLTLSAEGATILEQALEKGMTPIGVVYDMKYLAMRPAIDVEITADFERIFNHFSASLEAQYTYFRAGIEAAFESLVQSGAITIKVITFTDQEDEKEQERWALEFFREELLSKWFEPTLTPGQLAASQAEADPLSEVISTGRDLLRGGRNDTDSQGRGGGTTGRNDGPARGGQPGQAGRTEVQRAALSVDSTTPAPLPAGYGVSHTPAASGEDEVITITGAGAVVRVAGQAVTPDAQGRVTVRVPSDAEKAIEVDWPAQARDEVFGLFFQFDKPSPTGWSTNPPSPEFRAYVDNSVNDDRYKRASGTLRVEGDGNWTGAEEGAARLTKWVQALPAPKNVRLDAYASHEHVNAGGESARTARNMELSRRRLDVARTVVVRAGGTVTAANAHGDVPASTRPGSHTPMGGDPDNRVVHATARVSAGDPMRWRGRLRRAAAVVIPPAPPAPPAPPGPVPPGPAPAAPPPPAPVSMGNMAPAAASLKLKFVRQEEKKTLKFRYNRSEAVRRTYAPQGFFGLLLGDISDPVQRAKYFQEIDLDDPFFREFQVEASSPIDFEAVGLLSAQVAVDYGDPAKPRDHKHVDLVFTPGDTGPKSFKFFLNSTRDTDYKVGLQYHFSPQSGWVGDTFSYAPPPARTEDRTLFVNPYEHVDFREVTVTAGEVDWEVVDAIHVRLRAVGYGDPEPRTVLTLRRDSPPQTWKLRGARPAPADRRVVYELEQRLKDGGAQKSGPFDADVPVIVVHDTFVDALKLEFIPVFDPATVTRAFIDVEYKDAPNNYDRDERLELTGRATDPIKLRIALRNRTLRKHRHRFTFVRPNGGFDQRPWVETEEELIAVQ